jgi:sugar-phosphatase
MMELSYDAICFDLFGTLVTGEGAAIEGAREALALLPPGRWAIVTSCGRPFAQELIAAARLTTPAVLITGSDVIRNKPHPEPYALATARLGVPPARALAVEDSPSGASAARGAGLDVLLIGGNSASAAADFVVGRFADIAWGREPGGEIRLRF